MSKITQSNLSIDEWNAAMEKWKEVLQKTTAFQTAISGYGSSPITEEEEHWMKHHNAFSNPICNCDRGGPVLGG